MHPIQLDLIDQIICIISTGVRNINTILLIFMKINLQMGENLTVATIQRRVASLSSIFNLTKS